MKLHSVPEAPVHLSATASAKWKELCGLKLQMETGLRVHDLALIEFAAITYDKAMEALRDLDKHGITVLNEEQQKLTAHPAAAVFSKYHGDYVKRLIDLGLARVKPAIEAPDAEAAEEPAEVTVPEHLTPRELMQRLKIVG